MSLQGHRSDLNPAPLRLAAVSFVVDEVLGGIDSAVAELRAGNLTKVFLIDKLKPYKDDPVMLENEAYFLWNNSDDGVFGTKNGRSDLIKAVLAQVNQIRSNELEAISPCNAVAVEDGTLVSISTNRKKKRKLNIEDYGTKEQLSLLENLRLQRKDLQGKIDSVMEKEEALMAEFVQIAAAEDIDPEPASKVEEKPGRADITSASLKLLFAMRKVQVDEFFEFSSAREKLRENLDNGASGVKAYAGVSPGYAELFSRKQVHNVDRSADPPTKGFLILATSLLSTCGSTSHSYDLLVLHYSLWRTVAGAVPFALLVGFVYAWTPLEENRIRNALQLIWRKGPRLVSIFVGRAYSAIRTLQYGLMNASASKMDFVLNTPTRIKEKHPRMWLTLTWPGRAETLSSLWSIAPSVTATRTMLSKERLTQELARAPLFGTDKAGGVREPGFGAKEIAEDMLLTTFFSKQPADTNTYQVMAPRWHQGMTGPRVAGTGAVAGLQFLFDKDGLTQIEAVLLMKALYVELLPRWKERHSRVLMLHDIQFQLCQYSRKYTKTMPERRQKDELEHRVVGWVSEALNMLSGGSNPELIFAQFRTHIASLEDVR